MSEKWLERAKVLVEGLPYIKPYFGKIIVVKYGGNAMGDDDATLKFASDMVLLKEIGINPIVVHGGGPQIGEMLDKVNVQSEFKNGIRVTDKATMEVAQMVLCGPVNQTIVQAINKAGGMGVGISGVDGNMLTVEKMAVKDENSDSNIEKVVDMGFVGTPTKFDATLLEILTNTNAIPVVSPISIGECGNIFNVNADSAAGAIASGMKAKRLVLLTDIEGVLDGDKKLVSELNVASAKRMIKDGVAVGGMIPKIETCIKAIEDGLEGAVITDGRLAHSVLMEVLTEKGSGTLITAV
ncbi:MAG: acetylglutamate kinase [Alphaproteobacteria bacterium]